MRIFALALVFCSNCVLADSSSRIKDEITRLEREWSAAFLRHDVAALDRIIAEDFVGTDGRGVMSTKADEIQEAKVLQTMRPRRPLPSSMKSYRTCKSGCTALLRC